MFRNAIVAGITIALLGGAAQWVHADLITGTTYQYAHAPSLGSGSASESDRQTSMGNGILNNGIVGDNAWLDTTSATHPYPYEGAGLDGGVWLQGTPVITFELGNVHNLEKVVIHFVDANSGVTPAGTISVEVVGAGTAQDTTFLGETNLAITGVTYYGDVNLGYGGAYIPLEIDLTGKSGSTVNITLSDNLFGAGGWVGLNEVEFHGSVVPEPASLALMGLGGLLVLRRRRGIA